MDCTQESVPLPRGAGRNDGKDQHPNWWATAGCLVGFTIVLQAAYRMHCRRSSEIPPLLQFQSSRILQFADVLGEIEREAVGLLPYANGN